MKKIHATVLLSLMIFTGINYGKEDKDQSNERVPVNFTEALSKANSACGSPLAEESLKWLKDIIIKAEEDVESRKYKGNYIGRIYLTSYRGKPVFYVQMVMGSGGLPGIFIDCSGTVVTRISGARNTHLFKHPSALDHTAGAR